MNESLSQFLIENYHVGWNHKEGRPETVAEAAYRVRDGLIRLHPALEGEIRDAFGFAVRGDVFVPRSGPITIPPAAVSGAACEASATIRALLDAPGIALARPPAFTSQLDPLLHIVRTADKRACELLGRTPFVPSFVEPDLAVNLMVGGRPAGTGRGLLTVWTNENGCKVFPVDWAPTPAELASSPVLRFTPVLSPEEQAKSHGRVVRRVASFTRPGRFGSRLIWLFQFLGFRPSSLEYARHDAELWAMWSKLKGEAEASSAA